jgi:hypothetical protein
MSNFSPAEVAAAKRCQAEADQRRAAEMTRQERERQDGEHRARVAECEANLREEPAHTNSSAPKRRTPSTPALS